MRRSFRIDPGESSIYMNFPRFRGNTMTVLSSGSAVPRSFTKCKSESRFVIARENCTVSLVTKA